MNTTPNPNYPLPEKWYVKRTPENSIKVNNLCSQILETDLMWGDIPSDHSLPHFTPYIHSVFSESKKKCFTEPQEGYTEVTYEDLWLAYMIPEKWYCTYVNRKDLERWMELNDISASKYCTVYVTEYLVLSKHLVDDSYFWGGTLGGLKGDPLYKDYKEISKETYLELLNILEQKKNTNTMSDKNESIPTEVIISITEFNKIRDVACEAWKSKLKAYIISNLQDDCVSIIVTRKFYNEMIKASCVRNGINQADVINSVLPMFKHDPYKVFRDAEKEGETIQLFNIDKWLDIENPAYSQKPEKYRIKHKHQDLIDEWEASGRTKVVQWLSVTDTWKEVLDNNPSWFENNEYRFKPEPEYVPFTFEDYELFFGKIIKSKDGRCVSMITHAGTDNRVCIGGAARSDLEYVFKRYVFLDGTPFGKLVQK